MKCNVLLSSAGRRVGLLRTFQSALDALGLDGVVIAADTSPLSAAFQAADEAVRVPRCTSDEFIPAMLDFCQSHDVRLVVPTIDTELAALAENRVRFAEAGIAVAISDVATIDVGVDKQRTHAWLTENGFPTVGQAGVDSVLNDRSGSRYPLIVKPRRGSASIGVTKVGGPEELALVTPRDDFVVQEIASGDEYTIDVFVDRSGRALCMVPRRRIEVRGGEVSKGVTVRGTLLEELARSIGEALPGAYGALNVQVFLDADENQPRVIEINPRFGGGFPLAWEAGADFPRWLLEDVVGLPSSASADTWKHGLVMLRYDDAVFVDEREMELESGSRR